MPTKNFILLVSFIFSALSVSAQVVIMDNTANGTATLTNNLASINSTNQMAKVFTTPAFSSNLSAIKMSLYNTTATGSYTATVIIKLYLVDGSNNPTGSALATQSFTTSLNNTPAYYNFNLTDANWPLAASTTYALVINGSTPTGTVSWTNTSNSYTMSEGFTYVSGRRTTNTGSTWAANTYANGMQLSVSSVPLPIKLKNFSAVTEESFVNLNWVTESESGTKGFTIEKSADGRTFHEVSFVTAKNLEGGSTYHAKDIYETGNIFYRLKTIDLDGSFEYSKVIQINPSKVWNQSVQVYPNPATTSLNVLLESADNDVVLKLSDLKGHLILKNQIAAGQKLQTLSLNNLSSGVYVLTISKIDGSFKSIIISKL